eukprot:CAMPEP_0115135116 /NCGR_PEP_ID=MMETSP0227-20121206/55519_1 /TAXON_ID=89957 /ORGANISM="Polarella glacialis, Strain CCMP 1383" /LENGTH=43 /DNA_ID= /DNA_START= /DNA_END= /DNA_ORIENTATION=
MTDLVVEKLELRLDEIRVALGYIAAEVGHPHYSLVPSFVTYGR